MKINFDAAIKDFDDKPMTEKMSASAKEEIGRLSKPTRDEIAGRLDDKDVTLASLALSIVRATFRDEGELSEGTKNTRFKLGMKAALGGEQDLTDDERVELRKMLVRGYDALLAMRGVEIIDAAKVAADAEKATA